MVSQAFLQWQSDRMLRLDEIDRQCAASLALAVPNPALSEENLRAYVVLLSAHFQGFCRDLYTESAQAIASKVRLTLQVLIQDQFSAHRELDHGNPDLANLAEDFDRLGFSIRRELGRDLANAMRLQHLAELNKWRNVAAHQSQVLPPGGLLSLSALRSWKVSCHELSSALNDIV